MKCNISLLICLFCTSYSGLQFIGWKKHNISIFKDIMQIQNSKDLKNKCERKASFLLNLHGCKRQLLIKNHKNKMVESKNLSERKVKEK